MEYKVLSRQRFDEGDYAVVPVAMEHMRPIKDWRNAQLEVLRQENLLTDEQQEMYFKNVVSKLFEQEKPAQIIVSFFFKQQLIGYGGLVHINWPDRRAEVSFLLDNTRISDETLYGKEFSIFLSLIKQMAFVELNFNRIYTETFDIRAFHIGILEANGFRLEGRMRDHVMIKDSFHDSLIHGYLRKYGSI
jgi:RimJ/RimL family protein N-acetyltransferase